MYQQLLIVSLKSRAAVGAVGPHVFLHEVQLFGIDCHPKIINNFFKSPNQIEEERKTALIARDSGELRNTIYSYVER